VSPHEQAHVVVRMTGLHRVLPLYPTEPQALEEL
jgi:hypothetical protein